MYQAEGELTARVIIHLQSVGASVSVSVSVTTLNGPVGISCQLSGQSSSTGLPGPLGTDRPGLLKNLAEMYTKNIFEDYTNFQ